MLNDVSHAADEGKVMALVLLDLSSAFDTVDLITLLNMLEWRFLVEESVLAWFHHICVTTCRCFVPTGKSQKFRK